MGLDEFTWTAAPVRRWRTLHGLARAIRGIAWSVYWLAVLVIAIALGWGIAEGLHTIS
ncbi:MAG TPA: hypothetical protein VFE14_03965 [Micromonosporaceae bacterium]|jgi:hypothetical protein|nr:hypothetical protein [Micromonosporaceae bacterium]